MMALSKATHLQAAAQSLPFQSQLHADCSWGQKPSKVHRQRDELTISYLPGQTCLRLERRIIRDPDLACHMDLSGSAALCTK